MIICSIITISIALWAIPQSWKILRALWTLCAIAWELYKGIQAVKAETIRSQNEQRIGEETARELAFTRRQDEEKWGGDERKPREDLREAANAADFRRQQAREIQERHDRELGQRRRKSRQDYTKWRKECDIAFHNKASITRFPFPTLPQCSGSSPDCFAFGRYPAPACKHNVKQFLEDCGVYTVEFLREERNR